jgi:Acetyltransferase (GNAT) family
MSRNKKYGSALLACTEAAEVIVPGKEDLQDIFSWARLPIVAGQEYCWLAVRHGEKLMAYAHYRLMRGHPDTAIIDHLESRAYYRRRGYGRLLVHRLQADFPHLIAHQVLRKARPFWQFMQFVSEHPDAFWDDDWFWSNGIQQSEEA